MAVLTPKSGIGGHSPVGIGNTVFVRISRDHMIDAPDGSLGEISSLYVTKLIAWRKAQQQKYICITS